MLSYKTTDLDRYGRGPPLVGRGDAAFLAEYEDCIFLVGSADVQELLGIKIVPWLAHHLPQDKPAVDVAEGEPVRLGCFEELIHLDKAARSCHVLHNDRRIARDMFAYVTCNDPRPEVKTSSC